MSKFRYEGDIPELIDVEGLDVVLRAHQTEFLGTPEAESNGVVHRR